MKLTTLKKRAEFLRIRGGDRCSVPSFVLETKVRQDDHGASSSHPRFGFTVTKTMGNAVTRNRIRRRLKAAVMAVADGRARTGHDYVLIARKQACAVPFDSLKKDLERAFLRVHHASAEVKPRRETH